MGPSVEIVKSASSIAPPALGISLFGPLEVRRSGVLVPLPQSRKLRALLAMLVVEPAPIGRRRLCDPLWDRPNDPRAELRWHLSKLRRIVDSPDRPRLRSKDDAVGIDLDDCMVDALEVMAIKKGDPPSVTRLISLSDRFRGPFLGELDLSGPHAETWLTAQRRRFAACHASILRSLVAAFPCQSDAVSPYLERWLDLAPFEIDAHRALLARLIRDGRVAEAEAHVASTERLFLDEGVPTSALRQLWNEMRRHVPAVAAVAGLAMPVDQSLPLSTDAPRSAARRSALAVMPFRALHDDPVGRRLANGLTGDVITRLAKLRSLSIIARGSVFALADGITSEEAGRRLGVDYLASGMLHRETGRTWVEIELVETRSNTITLAQVCEVPAADLLDAVDELGNRIVAALTAEIEQTERNRAILRSPTSLDAWGAHHRGLWHMYRFTKADNAQAQSLFARAVALDPTFSRAHACLSFTHWQDAFQAWADPVRSADRAYAAAMESLLADEKDPAAHCAFGRASWLRRSHDDAATALRRSVDLSPNFALGHYSLAFVEAQTGDAKAAIAASDTSRALSPYDPMMFGMLGSRGLAHLRLGQYMEAADWATRAAACPNAHINMLGIAALCLAMADRVDEGRLFAARIHAVQPGYGIDTFLGTFHFPPDIARRLRVAATRVSLT